jgi:hypothetical protein
MARVKYQQLLGSVPAIAGLMERTLAEKMVGRKRELLRELVRELIEAYAPFVPNMPQSEEMLPLVDDVFDALLRDGFRRLS